MAQMDAREEHLKHAIVSEGNTASHAPHLIDTAMHFHLKAKSELADIAAAQRDAESILKEKLAKLRALFAEQKQYEILHRQKMAAQQQAVQKKEQEQLDEVASLTKN